MTESIKEMSIETMAFETALTELANIVAELENGNLPLKESLTLFERGQKLADRCNLQLEQASLRVEQLTSDGEIVTID